MYYLVSLLSQVCIYTIQVASLDLLVGYCGIYSFGQSAFVGVGAYTAALLLTTLHVGFFASLVAAVAMASVVALVVGLPTLRLSGDYFVLGSIGLSMVATSIFENWIDVTNGPYGVYGIPVLSIFGWRAATPTTFLVVAAALTAFLLWIKHLLIASPFGIVLQAIREDETVVAALGKDVTRFRIVIFVIAAGGTAVSGLLTAYNLRFIDPTLFDLQSVFFLWAALFIGGCASWVGNFIGPLLLVGFPEALRFIGLEGTLVAHVREVLFGALLIAVTIFRPQGLAGTYRIR
jgi:branched-chain amino acid transport system permease protein